MFQFTHPGKGAAEHGLHVDSLIKVSIHAPWEGCDSSRQEPTDGDREFQFTHPGKGATMYNITDTEQLHVSIHAPWEGCDM